MSDWSLKMHCVVRKASHMEQPYQSMLSLSITSEFVLPVTLHCWVSHWTFLLWDRSAMICAPAFGMLNTLPSCKLGCSPRLALAMGTSSPDFVAWADTCMSYKGIKHLQQSSWDHFFSSLIAWQRRH
jgi:hypothetical protein